MNSIDKNNNGEIDYMGYYYYYNYLINKKKEFVMATCNRRNML